MAKRVFLIVLDSFGIGGAPDAAAFGDEGSNTLAACEQVEDLAYRDDVKALLLEDVEHSRRRSAE